MIRAGKLDRRIVIERETEMVDDAGRVARAWAPIATVRAELVTFTVEEEARAFGEASPADLVFKLRYLPGIRTADRVSYNGKAFNIRRIVEIGRRRGMELRVETSE
ncbi:phage head closure protein [Fulvimarina sp. 2208YS6-2-32]|uniref:Phage head closure protein n=1 Tax=Fulvimarina uroteuthidis TaxID=3098149 RepID=A0ABU5HXE8_9HYPH|nr:phage head closure protein [Fulvimarina sp. 2208YS6-2-32]MDY8107767.1 phage head closure protein [Fulvimarina sp. 2208YS6-2-32]